MEVSRIRALRGPNLWSRHTAIEAIVACEGDERAIADLPGFEARLRERFPEIGAAASRPATSTPSRWRTRWNSPRSACRPRPAARSPSAARRRPLEPGVYQVVVEYTEEAVGRLAFELAEALCHAALDDQPFDLAAALSRLRELDEDVRLGPSTGAIVARRRGPRHSLPPPDRGQPGAVRLGQQTAAHPGRRNRTAPAPSPNRSPRTRS